jgi:hypothetical protein
MRSQSCVSSWLTHSTPALGYLAINQPWFADSPMRPIVEKHMADSAFLNFTGVDRHELSREIVRNIDNTEEIILTFEQKPNVIWGIDTDQGVTETITDHLIKKTKILQDKHTRVWDYEEYFDEKPLVGRSLKLLEPFLTHSCLCP